MGLGTRIVILRQLKISALIEEEETLNGDNVLYFVVIKLAGKGGVLKREDHRRVNDKQ
jgi:hypothetical protein